MAQPSVAREPSMEEILASIRRIIESNDPVNGGSPSQDFSSLSDEQGSEDQDGGYDGGEFVAANDAGPAFAMFQRESERVEPAPRREPVQERAEDAPKSVSLADLAARVRSASERMERPVQSAPPTLTGTPLQATIVQPRREPPPVAEEPQRAPAPAMAARLAEMRDQQLRPSMAAEPSAPIASSPAVDLDRPVAAPEAPMARIASVEVRVERQEPAFLEPVMEETYRHQEDEQATAASTVDLRQERGEEGRDLTALVSAATVEQVSRSFSELAAAFDGTERRSLDEMAEEMLRPMLKDWLDDNLPTLVERLVREEIERVARGPRR